MNRCAFFPVALIAALSMNAMSYEGHVRHHHSVRHHSKEEKVVYASQDDVLHAMALSQEYGYESQQSFAVFLRSSNDLKKINKKKLEQALNQAKDVQFTSDVHRFEKTHGQIFLVRDDSHANDIPTNELYEPKKN